MRKCSIALFISFALQAAPPPGDKPTLAARDIQGTVVAVDPRDASITLRQPNLIGYLRLRVKSYQVKQLSALKELRPGDRITGVYLQRDGMLHRLRRVQKNRTTAHS
jgi:hypothetical protein